MNKPVARAVVGGAVIVLMILAAYAPALRGGFIWDDDAYVTGNLTLRDAAGLGRMWLTPGAIPQYYPLVHTTFWLEYHLWGLSPAGYHAVNIALHALASVLVWRVLRRLAVPGAWLAGAIFAVHPVMVESVAWVTERKNVLSLVFYLLALAAYLRFDPPETAAPAPAARRWRFWAAALVLFACALLSKSVTASLPAAVLLILWWKRGRIGRRDVWPLAPFFALGLAAGLATVWLEEHHVGATGGDWAIRPLERCLVAGRAVAFYVGKLFWPAELTFIYPRWTIDSAAWTPYLWPAGVVAAVAALFLLRRRIGRGPVTAALFFIGTLTPALGFFNVYPFRYSFVADHFQYHAAIGVIALVAGVGTWAWGRGVWRRRTGYAAAVVVLAVFSVMTWRQCHIYESLETLWADTLRKDPACWMAYNNLGSLRYEQNRPDDALPLLEKAAALNPRDADIQSNLGRLLERFGRIADARRHLAEALRLDPEHAASHNMIGTILCGEGRVAEAMEHFRAAVKSKPTLAEAQNNLAFLLLGQGKMEEAETHATLAVRLKPEFAEAHNTLAIALAQRGRHDEAVAQFREALRLDPTYANARYNLGVELESIGRYAEALVILEQASRDQPASALLHVAVGKCLIDLGRFDEAVTRVSEALRLDPGCAPAYHQMGLVWRRRGDAAQAVRYFLESLRLRPGVPAVLNDLAWLQATHPDARVQNGAQAVAAAERVCRLTQRRNPAYLDTLAAAYAEARRFNDAVATAREAAALAGSAGQPQLAAQVRARLALYEAGKPYREEAPAPATPGQTR